jgi:hypothetical protein
MNLYLRYLLPDKETWKNAAQGTELERAAAYRFNRENRKWLLKFSLRWFVLGVIFNIAASLCLLALAWDTISIALEIPSIIAFVMSGIFMSVWAQLEWSK